MSACRSIKKTNKKRVITLQNNPGSIILENGYGIPRISVAASQKIDNNAIYFVLCYRLITFFPIRFPDREKSHEKAVFGFHPNTWSTAWLLVSQFKAYRHKPRGPAVSIHPPDGSKFGPPFRLGTVNFGGCNGAVSPEEQARPNNVSNRKQISVQNRVIEKRMAYFADADDENEDLVTATATIKDICARHPEIMREFIKDGRIEDHNGQLGRLLTDAYEEVGGQAYQYQGNKAYTESPLTMLEPLTPDETDILIDELKDLAGVQPNDRTEIPERMKKLISENLHQITEINRRRQEISTMADSGQEERDSVKPDDDAHIVLRLMKKFTGGFEPDAEEYAQIIQDLDFGDEEKPRHKVAEASSPPLRPHQAVGK